ncbi:MAG: ATP-binding protein [Dongiaceae bacterium]
MPSNTAVLPHSIGGRDLQREGTAVDDFVADVLDAYPAVGGIELRRDLDCADLIFADRDAMRRALVALLDNAAQSLQDPAWIAPAGHRPQCLVSTQFITTHVLLTVSDNSPGIARELLPKIFDVGSSLLTARQIVEKHGGTVDVASEAGQGTTVTIWLPRHRAARPTVRVAVAA